MTSALSHHFQMFCHISVDEVCRKIEELVHIHEQCFEHFFLMFKTLKVVARHAQLLEKKTPFTNVFFIVKWPKP